MAAAAAPTAALCTFGRSRAVLLRALWRIRLFHLKFLTFFRPGGGPDRLFPRRGLLLRLYGRPHGRRALGTRRALAAPLRLFLFFFKHLHRPLVFHGRDADVRQLFNIRQIFLFPILCTYVSGILGRS